MLFFDSMYIMFLKYCLKGDFMKKVKKITALIGAVLLVLMYLSTLLFAFIDRTASQGLFKASVAMTILVPVLLYAYSLFYKLSRDKDASDPDHDAK